MFRGHHNKILKKRGLKTKLNIMKTAFRICTLYSVSSTSALIASLFEENHKHFSPYHFSFQGKSQVS